ncbi:ABC transporter substrate-binding protein [Niveibacterium umoris]|uniref:ABC transporter substrate-binding protein n=1 Tax=Niveibacterium umoris TaxID=1193620 RepID=UPI00161844C9
MLHALWRFVVLMVAGCALATALTANAAPSQERVTLQLKWRHQFQFAGYYAALFKGYYWDAGLDVDIREAQSGEDPIQQVLSGHAEYGVGTSDLLLLRQGGKPVVVLAAIFQHSPLTLLVRRESGIRSLPDLVGKRVMIEPNSAELFALLKRSGVDSDALKIASHTFTANDLIAGKLDAMSAYSTDEPFELKEAGVAYDLFEPRSAGIDFYGDNLFTTENEIRKHPDRVRAFREATLKGWAYAMQHQEEIIDLILTQYGERHSADHLRFEAKVMERLLQPTLVQPGYMHLARWQHIADTYASLGLLPASTSLEGFLYEDVANADSERNRRWLVITLAGLLIFAAIAGYVLRLNWRLHASRERQRVIVDAAPLALFVLSDENRIQDWNRAAETTFGWKSDDVRGRNMLDFVPPETERGALMSLLDDARRDKSSTRSGETWANTADGRRIRCEWRFAAMPSSDGRQSRLVAMAIDVTAQRELESRLQLMAHADPLTGLANRSLFYDRVERALSLAQRHTGHVALIYIDLDDFKRVNDTQGHEAGDIVLRTIAMRLRRLVRESDTVARIGGDEFVILLQEVGDREAAMAVANKAEEAICLPIEVRPAQFAHVGGSIGVSLSPQHGTDSEALLRSADAAMYRIKHGGKRGVACAS